MADVIERIGSFVFHLRTEQTVKPKPNHILRFDVQVRVRYYSYYLSNRIPLLASTLFEMTIRISCENFFENHYDFLLSFLCNRQCPLFLNQDNFDQISERIVYRLQQLLESLSDPQSEHPECKQVFPLTLDIDVEMLVDGERIEKGQGIIEESAVMEECMQQSVTMIPASKEAIHCLITVTEVTDSLLLNNENCNICMDKFYVEEGTNDDVELSSMPCDHVFHHQCIVKWLQTSHTCPLCRYAMPTAKD